MTDGEGDSGGGCGQHWGCVWFSLWLNHEPLIKWSKRKYLCRTTHKHTNKLSLSLTRFPFLIGIKHRGRGGSVQSFFPQFWHLSKKGGEGNKEGRECAHSFEAYICIYGFNYVRLQKPHMRDVYKHKKHAFDFFNLSVEFLFRPVLVLGITLLIGIDPCILQL